MTEHPIPFREEEVRAILDGRKTMTRQVCKDQGDDVKLLWVENQPVYPEYWKGKKGEPYTGWVAKFDNLGLYMPRACPYGVPGDRLWVRETLQRYSHGGNLPDTAQYVADITPVPFREGCWSGYCGRAQWQWKNRSVIPSIHMPRWASRITLEIVSVRVERLQEIDNHQSWKEGIPEFGRWIENDGEARDEFARLWDSLNAKRGYAWDSNPWVWVIEFKRAAEQQE